MDHNIVGDFEAIVLCSIKSGIRLQVQISAPENPKFHLPLLIISYLFVMSYESSITCLLLTEKVKRTGGSNGAHCPCCNGSSCQCQAVKDKL